MKGHDKMLKGIDISEHQPKVDWPKVKASGITFVMLRATWGVYPDDMFEKHIAGALSVGLNVGAYGFSVATSVEEAKAEAKALLAIVKPYNLTYPLCMDAESEKDRDKKPIGLITVDKKTRTDCCLAYLETLEKAGYYVALYANRDWLTNKLDFARLSSYDVWLAEWDVGTPTWRGNHGIWQSGIGHVDGIGTVDVNISYLDYPIFTDQTTKKTPAAKVISKPASPKPAPVANKEKYISHKVQPGESFWRIAQECLGDGNRFMELVTYNHMTKDTVIHPGDIIKIPCTGEKKIVGQKTQEILKSKPPRTYTVKDGESYWGIANKLLRNGSRWPEIKRLNDNKDIIHPGDILVIPEV